MSRLRCWYTLYRARYFRHHNHSTLPRHPILKFAKLKHGKMGVQSRVDVPIILINQRLKRFPLAWRATLLHEMAHLATETEKEAHGPRFHKELRRLIRAGAFDDLL